MVLPTLPSLLGWHTHVQRYTAVLVLTLLHLATTTYSTRMHNIHWNASNPLFRIDRTDNVIDINGGNHPWEYDQVNIVCPVYKPGTRVASQEQYIIYSVTKQEYESCRITQSNPKIIAVCNRPHQLMYFTITFRSFTPTPGGLEFRPGQNYYFISTSSKNDLHRRVGGGCSTNNMKVTFKVAEDDKDLEQSNDINAAEAGNDSRPLVPSIVTNSKQQTYYYPTSEVEQAELYHHQKRHKQDQSDWLHSGAASNIHQMSLHFLAITVVLLMARRNSYL